MLVMLLLVIPLLGVLWFVNFTVFLKNLKNGKSTHNQTVLGSALLLYITKMLVGYQRFRGMFTYILITIKNDHLIQIGFRRRLHELLFIHSNKL